MKDSYKMSVIIPCYNSSKSIIDYLESIKLGSLINEIEFVIVDDCSKDDSYINLIEYSKKTELVVIAAQNSENSGPGVARNTGIAISRGEYLTFLDSDDRFKDDYFEKIYPYLNGFIDCIIYDMKIIKNNRETIVNMFFNGSKEEKPNKNDCIVFIRGCTAGKIYKASIVKDNNISFLNQRRNEDLPFTKTAVSNCDNIIHLTEPLYYYYQEESSLTHNKKLYNYRNALNAFNYIKDNVDEKYCEELGAIFMLEYVYSSYLNTSVILSKKEWKKLIEEGNSVYKFDLKNKYFIQMSKRIKFIVKLIVKRRYHLVKIICKLQDYMAKKRY